MPKKSIIPFCAAVFFSLFFSAIAQAKEINPLPPFNKEDRVLILAPHPDDETIGCGGVIQRALASKASVRVAYLTNGDNNIFSILFYNQLLFPLRLVLLNNSDFINLGKLRQEEARNAMKTLGLKKDDLIFLGYPDHGTDRIFVFHWGRKKPYKSFFSSSSSVPYKDSASYQKEFKGDNILEDIKKILRDYKPTKVFISHPADLNGDHWALYLYTLVALADLDKIIPDPEVYPYIVHVPAWPMPRNYHPELAIEPPKKFFADSLSSIQWQQLKLAPEEIEKKHQAMLCYKSQTRISAFYLLSFVRQNELFGDFPTLELKKQSSQKPGVKNRQYIFTADNQWVGFAVVDDYLLVKAKKPKELKNRLSFVFFFDSYNTNVPFSQTPDIIIITKYDKLRIYDPTTDKYIDCKDASIQLNPESLILRIPLSILGNPEGFIFAFTSENNFLPLGITSFRTLIIE